MAEENGTSKRQSSSSTQSMASSAFSAPNPDPTARTVEQLTRDIGASREIVEAQIKGNKEVVETRLTYIDQAMELLQRSTDKLPALIRDEIYGLEKLHQEKFESISNELEIRFRGIDTQFTERDTRTAQLGLADKTAIAAALQAQKEAANSTTESIVAILNKMEAGFTKLFDTIGNSIAQMVKTTDDKINDVKSRLDKGEGRTSVSDPATIEALRLLATAVSNLDQNRDRSVGHTQGADKILGYLGVFGMMVIAVAALFIHHQ
jgi:hypothetical protein